MDLQKYTGTWEDQFGNLLVIDASNEGEITGKYKANDGEEKVHPIIGYWNAGAEFPTLGFVLKQDDDKQTGVDPADKGSLCTKWGLKKVPRNR